MPTCSRFEALKNVVIPSDNVVLLTKGEVHRAVGQVPRQVVARLLRLDFTEPENLLIKIGGFLQIFDFQSQVHDAVHICPVL